MSDSSKREWRFYLDDMIAFAGKVIAYTEGLDQAAFVASGLNYDATLRNLELVGEAATHIPDDIRTAHPEVPWRLIIATRKPADSRLSRHRRRHPPCRRCWNHSGKSTGNYDRAMDVAKALGTIDGVRRRIQHLVENENTTSG